jgi:hypothetical protein
MRSRPWILQLSEVLKYNDGALIFPGLRFVSYNTEHFTSKRKNFKELEEDLSVTEKDSSTLELIEVT